MMPPFLWIYERLRAPNARLENVHSALVLFPYLGAKLARFIESHPRFPDWSAQQPNLAHLLEKQRQGGPSPEWEAAHCESPWPLKCFTLLTGWCAYCTPIVSAQGPCKL